MTELPMNPLAQMLSLLRATPWPECRCEVSVGGAGVTIRRGGMQATAWNADGDLVEVIYEHARHQPTRVRLPPAAALKLVLTILGRERLCRVAIPEA
jgi:hypothetical protein